MDHEVTARCYARAGLLGNPSDGYGGKTISIIVKNFRAEARLRPAERFLIERDAREVDGYESLADLHSYVQREGYYDSERLVKASCKQFADHFAQIIDLTQRPCSIAINSNIPRQVGLAGSSAIVMAVFRGLLKWFGVELAPADLATRVLWAEQRELGIPAGYQDRVIQAHEGVLFMDFSPTAMQTIDGIPRGHYQILDPTKLPPLYIAYTRRASEPTEVTHGSLRKRFDEGVPIVVAAMQQFADFADRGRQAITTGDYSQFNELIDANFDLRRKICDLNPHHVEMIETARATGASAKFCGSGGAIIGMYKSPEHLRNLQKSLATIGCEVFTPRLV